MKIDTEKIRKYFDNIMYKSPEELDLLIFVFTIFSPSKNLYHTGGNDWGKIPKYYPKIGYAKNAIKYHKLEMCEIHIYKLDHVGIEKYK